jgi:hypothetical protein
MRLHPIGRIASHSRGKIARLRPMESPPPTRSPQDGPSGTLAPMRPPDPILAKITAVFAGLDVVKTRGGYTLYDRRTDQPVARLRAIADTDRFELLYWSVVTEAWHTFGDFGRLKLTLERAHEIFHAEAIFRIQKPRRPSPTIQ